MGTTVGTVEHKACSWLAATDLGEERIISKTFQACKKLRYPDFQPKFVLPFPTETFLAGHAEIAINTLHMCGHVQTAGILFLVQLLLLALLILA